MQEKLYITALRLCPGVGNKTLRDILDFFDDASQAWDNLPNYHTELRWNPRQLEVFLKHKSEFSLQNLEKTLLKNKISVLTIYDEAYPLLLKEIYNPPAVLFTMGQKLTDGFSIAMVGSRRPTAYGKVITEKLAEELAENGITVVSGMARGIDAYAHKGALAKGSTVAVLGSGVDIIYPRENAKLYYEILESGTVISEFPPGTPPERGHFPARNRIISGLSKGILVVEAAEKSGSLITADFALEQGRDVFAVPGPITSNNSAGCHGLIKNGAKLVTGVKDILEEYERDFHCIINKAFTNEAAGEEGLVLKLIDFQPIHFEQLLSRTSFDIGRLSKILMQLELKRDIRQLPGQYYVLDKVNLR